MPRHVVELPYAFRMNARRKRARNSVDMWMWDTVPVVLEEVDAVVAASYVARHGSPPDRTDFLHDGVGFMLPAGWDDAPADVGTLVAVGRNGGPGAVWSRHAGLAAIPSCEATLAGDPYDRERHRKDPFDPRYRFDDRVVEFDRTEYEARRDEAAAVLSRFVVHDGRVMVRLPEPVMEIWFPGRHADADAEPECAFVNVDGHDDGHFRLPFVHPGVLSSDMQGCHVEVARPDLFGFDPVTGNFGPMARQLESSLAYRISGEADAEENLEVLETAIECLEAADGRRTDPVPTLERVERLLVATADERHSGLEDARCFMALLRRTYDLDARLGRADRGARP